MDLDTRRNLKQNSFVYDMNGSPLAVCLSCVYTCCACTVLCVCVCVCVCVCLMWLHAVQLMFVLDMCNSSTKHNGSGQVVRVGAAASHVY